MSVKNRYSKTYINTIGNIVRSIRPSKTIEFGTAHGQTAVVIAGNMPSNGVVYTYDIDYVSSKEMSQRAGELNVNNKIVVGQKDFFKWLDEDEDFDLLYIDIHNDGRVIRSAYEKLNRQIVEMKKPVIFEGGIHERDKKGHGKSGGEDYPMYPLKDELGFKIIHNAFPGLSGWNV